MEFIQIITYKAKVDKQQVDTETLLFCVMRQKKDSREAVPQTGTLSHFLFLCLSVSGKTVSM